MIRVYDAFNDNNVCIIGLGYVGLTLAVVMAETGFNVTGVEINDQVLEKLNNKQAHFYEPGLEERMQQVVKKKRLKFHKYIPNDYKGSVFIITVGTPLDNQGKVRLDMIKNVSEEIAGKLKEGDLVIGRSTIKVGTTDNVIKPILEKAGVGFDLAFCPERTLEGKALEELNWLPQIVGASSNHAAIRTSQIFQFITPTVIRVSNIKTAETIKLIDNAHRDVLFAYSNEVARMCDAFGVSAFEVIDSGKMGYPRTNLFLPGPVGGPCLSKDPHILAESLADVGLVPEITKASRLINERQPKEVVSFIKAYTDKMSGFPADPIIALLGLAFKGRPATDDLRGTMAEPVFDSIKVHYPTASYRGYDAVVAPADVESFGLEPYSDLEGVMQESSIVLILNNHPVFVNMPIQRLSLKMRKPGLIYDFWNHFSAHDLELADGVRYIALGSHNTGR